MGREYNALSDALPETRLVIDKHRTYFFVCSKGLETLRRSANAARTRRPLLLLF